MKTSFARSNAMNRIRVFLMATCIIAVTPRLSGDIILLSRLSNAEAFATGHPYYVAPPQSQTGFLPANLHNGAAACFHGWTGNCCSTAASASNSSILINNPMEGLRVVGGGTASVTGCGGYGRAKLIVLSFTLTGIPYPCSISGQLNGASATAKLTSETGTIFERIGTTTLSESGTLQPGNYTLSVNADAG